jgi:hypothetical protein
MHHRQDQRYRLRRLIGGHDHGSVLVRLRQLDRGELALQQGGREEMPVPVPQPLLKPLTVEIQEDQPRLRTAIEQQIAIGPPQRGTGDHHRFPGRDASVHPGRDGSQPGPAVLVGERDAGVHLLDVLCRVEVVGVGETPVQPAGQHGADRGLAAARYSGHDHDHLRGP